MKASCGKRFWKGEFLYYKGNSCTMSRRELVIWKARKPTIIRYPFHKSIIHLQTQLCLLIIVWFENFASLLIWIYLQIFVAVSLILIFIFKNISWDPRNILWYVCFSTNCIYLLGWGWDNIYGTSQKIILQC